MGDAIRDKEMRAHAATLEEAANAIEAKESLSEIDDRAVEALRKAAYTLRRWQETLDG